MRRQRYPRREAAIRLGLPGDEPDRQHAGPDRQRVIRLVILGIAGPDLRRGLVERHVKDGRRLHLLRGRRPQLAPTAGRDPLREGFERRQLRRLSFDRLGRAEGHDGAVVERMVKARAREDDAVEQADGEADRHAALHLAQHAARRGAVPINAVAFAPIGRRRHIGLPLDDVADVTNKAGIEDGVDRLAVVMAALRQALDAGAGAGRCRFRQIGAVGHGLAPLCPGRSWRGNRFTRKSRIA